MKQLILLNPEQVSEEEASAYRVRQAARAVVVDEHGLVAVLDVTKEQYYKLPGGGMEEGEDAFLALRRECLEEMGCDIEVVEELGSVVEYRKIFQLKQISYCYIATVRGEKGPPHLTKHETDKGFIPLWLSYTEVSDAMASSTPTSVEGRLYIVPRDTFLLKLARPRASLL